LFNYAVHIGSLKWEFQMKVLSSAVLLIVLTGCATSNIGGQTADGLVRYELPEEVAYPEGIAYDAEKAVIYVAGSSDGQIARVDLRTGRGQLVGKGLAGELNGTFPGILGLKIDGRGRLWMAGGRTGKVYVADARTGALLQTIETPDAAAGLINDIAFAEGKAFFTDTFRPTLWAVDAGETIAAAPEPWLEFARTPLEYAEGANLNGITATPDGRTLLAGQMNKGLLFKIDLATRSVTPIDLNGETVTGVDGLVLSGQSLYVIRQPAGEIVTIKLATDMTSGEVIARTSVPGLLWPATGVIVGEELLVVNSQFNRRSSGDAERPFSIQRVPLSSLER
jgi:Cu-Zn family superoxide dismutase